MSCIHIFSEPLVPNLRTFSKTWNNPSCVSCVEEEKHFFCYNNEPSLRIMGLVLVRSTFCTRWRNANPLCRGAVGQLWCELAIRRGCSKGEVKRRRWVAQDRCTALNNSRGNKQCFEVYVRLEIDSIGWMGESNFSLWISPLLGQLKDYFILS